ncbi:YgjV family protein [Shewanella gelidii]|uniref:Uroporphyrinogen decarboxylase n=1 Tax=Shewanella gelidii TaxID=1642821 RepID=A0A917JXQ6_9GAMM|nr:YgjV family protein [Shewanella gelidii]MCL1098739.1 YgjV family protein [Shewanella gelidii]GGI88001.1 uroporphyrinogen decarboxylase [Shewanella gelidii]
MEGLDIVEVVGYMASVMVAISLMMKNIVWLRCLNFVGCSLFVAYGIAIAAWPVAGMNAFVACINVYHLVKLARSKVQKEEPVAA